MCCLVVLAPIAPAEQLALLWSPRCPQQQTPSLGLKERESQRQILHRHIQYNEILNRKLQLTYLKNISESQASGISCPLWFSLKGALVFNVIVTSICRPSPGTTGEEHALKNTHTLPTLHRLKYTLRKPVVTRYLYFWKEQNIKEARSLYPHRNHDPQNLQQNHFRYRKAQSRGSNPILVFRDIWWSGV